MPLLRHALAEDLAGHDVELSRGQLEALLHLPPALGSTDDQLAVA